MMSSKALFCLCLFGVLIAMPWGYSQNGGQKESDVEARVEAILERMSLKEKIGQMTQVDIDALADLEDISTYSLGSLLAGGNSEIPDVSAGGWAKAHDRYQAQALKSRLGIPLIFGIDAVHGHSNVDGAVIFPHNIGLGATRNPGLVERACQVVAEEMAATGIRWTFAPCVAVARDERWGRTYESFGDAPQLVGAMGAACVRGLQRDFSHPTSTLACAKHFVGDGGTVGGKDQGDMVCGEEELRRIHLSGYLDAIEAGVGSVMVSYSSWNGQKMHGHSYLLNVLRGELGFSGIVVSDWAAIDQLTPDYRKAIDISINAGLDMIMIPNGPGRRNNYLEFMSGLEELAREGKVPVSRIDDAVRRILRIKFALGLFERPYSDPEKLPLVGSPEHRAVARECVRESLVLLQNKGRLLPLAKGLARIHVAGKSADDIGNQCGGWTISWQGRSGAAISGGTTIRKAIERTVSPETQVTCSIDGTGAEGADAAVAVIGETPYAEMLGDASDLSLKSEDIETLENLRKAGVPTVVVLACGRPLGIEPALQNCGALLVAWLPGTEGQGVADVLFGDHAPTGKLPRSWPRSTPADERGEGPGPLFEYGFGLGY